MNYCGRPFTPADVELIRALIATVPPLSRFRLSREVCEHLNWRRLDGKLKDMSCRVALLRMQDDGLITLPPPRNAKPVIYRMRPEIEQAVLEPTAVPPIGLDRLTTDLVVSRCDSLLWNTYIQRHHYLGHRPLPGAQLRYLCMLPASSLPCSATEQAPGKSDRAMTVSAGRPISAAATCT